MKLLTSNFITCAVKSCRGTEAAYPLQFTDCNLEIIEIDYRPQFIINIMPRVDWDALIKVCKTLGNESLPATKPESFGDENRTQEQEEVLRSLHNVLLETNITDGKMTCGGCGHLYLIKSGIANMLLAEHEVI